MRRLHLYPPDSLAVAKLKLKLGELILDLRSKHKYETDLYWCHQMFFEGWTPGPPHIEEEKEIHEPAPSARCDL